MVFVFHGDESHGTKSVKKKIAQNPFFIFCSSITFTYQNSQEDKKKGAKRAESILFCRNVHRVLL